MDRWIGKVAVVTGASAGIGAQVVIDFAKAGLIVVGLARRKEKIEELKKQAIGAPGQIHACECDITCETSVKNAFSWIEKTFGGVNILINNAGRTQYQSILGSPDSIEHIRKIIDTNITGLLICTKAAFDILQKTGDIGHIVNISSYAGHVVIFRNIPNQITTSNIYPGTKHALRATNEVLRQELIHLNKKVKISMISPGVVKTEFAAAASNPDPEGWFKSLPNLFAEDISNAVLYVVGTPPHVQVHDIIIKPVGEPF